MPPGEANDGFAGLVTEHESPLLRYVTRLVGPAGDLPQDIVQETFCRLHRQLSKRPDAPVQYAKAWLYRVAHNLAMDHRRKRKRRADCREIGGDLLTDAPPADASQPDVAEAVAQREAGQQAMKELNQLPDELKHVLMLRVMQGLTLREVAHVTGTPLATVNYRINRALGQLAGRLEKAGVV